MRYYNVGKIVNTHGLRGEVRVVVTTDFVEERFRPGNTLYVFPPKAETPLPVEVAHVRPHKRMLLVKFKGYDTISSVEPWKGGFIKVAEEDRRPLSEGEFYFDQIIGLDVVDEDRRPIGRVKEILQPGANDVWVVERPGKRDLLVPYIDEVVRAVDLDGGRIVVRLLPGLDDDEQADDNDGGSDKSGRAGASGGGAEAADAEDAANVGGASGDGATGGGGRRA
ncbi:MAG: ribosome maturation factor RimM [Hydrogenibacillus sp.]|nr:ribosome maturation factor RimM [Hydrogenibacillus sp.]